MTGLVGAAGGLGGFLLPFGFGALQQRTGSFAVGFLLLSLVLVATAHAAHSRCRSWSTSVNSSLAVAR